MTSEFALTGAGGGGAMMIRKPDSAPVLYDFFVDTPPRTGKEELDFFGMEVDFGDSSQTFHIGKGSAAVPGTLLGLVIVQEEFGGSSTANSNGASHKISPGRICAEYKTILYL